MIQAKQNSIVEMENIELEMSRMGSNEVHVQLKQEKDNLNELTIKIEKNTKKMEENEKMVSINMKKVIEKITTSRTNIWNISYEMKAEINEYNNKMICYHIQEPILTNYNHYINNNNHQNVENASTDDMTMNID